ncbi:MAG TPA: tetratricopeptide repeat protein [Gammaproteobacteria bacterium]
MPMFHPVRQKLCITAIFCAVVSWNAQADSYDDGLMAFVHGDFRQAEQHFNSAASAGDNGARHMLARMHTESKGAAPDAQQAFKWYLQAAQDGMAQAQFELAERYFNGNGTRRDLAQAFHWYQTAAQQNHHIATERLAYFYETGQVVNRDAGYAQRLYNIAASEYDVFAQKGDAAAQNTLAGMYENAKGVKADNAMALFWYKKAALQDYALAQYNIGRLLMEHASSERTVAEAAYWLDLAAAQGLREAETMLVQIKQQYGTSIASR